jgi:hypothetical protein
VCDEDLIPHVLGPDVKYRLHHHHPEGGHGADEGRYGGGEPARADTMLGRTLTLDRARELNSRTYFYAMLKDNPSMTAIYPGIEDDLMRGAIDCHIHAYPDFVHRSQDMVEIAIDASRAGMRAIAFKDHWNLTANAAYLVQRFVDDMVSDGRLEHRVEVLGGIGLNHGINPEAVRIALQYPTCRLIWFPTFKSYGWARFAEVDTRDDGSFVRLVGPDGDVLPEVREVFELAADAGAVVSLGHTDFIELLPLCTLAKEMGVKTLLDHPLLELNKLLISEMKQLADLGTYVGTYCQPMIPSLYQPVADPMETIETIREVGADRCVTASDFGQVLHVNSVDGVKIFVRALLGFGVPVDDVRKIIQENPAELLGLEPLE